MCRRAVRPRTPVEIRGHRGRLGEFPIRTLSDFRSTLQTFMPGYMPAVVVRRQGRSLLVAVALEGGLSDRVARTTVLAPEFAQTPIAK